MSVSHDCIGTSGELFRIAKLSPLADCRLDIFLFFEDDVLAASCERSSRNFGVWACKWWGTKQVCVVWVQLRRLAFSYGLAVGVGGAESAVTALWMGMLRLCRKCREKEESGNGGGEHSE